MRHIALRSLLSMDGFLFKFMSCRINVNSYKRSLKISFHISSANIYIYMYVGVCVWKFYVRNYYAKRGPRNRETRESGIISYSARNEKSYWITAYEMVPV